ncbi:MAG TPA: hypothetical protein PLX89_21875 [Verrucomicrobiota bacterium]|nr:hypothetical protein [Verrucomicrobiales bacterium]HRI15654.1 hypothetical protein [Verrucomicrobiota bacterium]
MTRLHLESAFPRTFRTPKRDFAALILTLSCLSSGGGVHATTFHPVGDLPGGIVFSQVRDATKVAGVIYAVGSSAAHAGSTSGDTAILWSSTGGLIALPNLVANNTAVTFIGASAITPDAAFIASRARSVATGGARSAVRVTRAGLVNLNLGNVGGLTGNSAATAISADGSILYGLGNNVNRAVRYTADGPTATLIPFLNPGDTRNLPAGRGTSADGSVMVGWSSGPTSVRAFRYVHGVGVTALPLMAGGTWNEALALTPDARLTLLSGDSSLHTNGAMYLYEVTTGTIQPLGSPNESWFPPTLGGVTADGAVVAVTFGRDEVSGPRDAFFRNRHGWWILANALTAEGVNLAASGWVVDSVLGVSADGTLVFGEGRHDGNVEGYVAEFPPGYLAEFGAVTTPTLSIQRDREEVQLSWPANSTGFNLQGTGDLNLSDWQPVPGTPVNEGGVNRLNVVPADRTKWFRLFKAE